MRADQRVLQEGLAADLQQAQRLIMAAAILADGRPIPHPASEVGSKAELTLRASPRYVSRGGEKLEHALRELGLHVAGKVIADVGASTGGFTDCLLQHGATRVYAIDAGRGQLAEKLRRDERVRSLEQTNARFLHELPEPVGAVVMDVSFISATVLIPNALRWLADHPSGEISHDQWLLVLLKPQFELEPREAPRGVVKDSKMHALAIARFLRWALEQPLRLSGLVGSPLLGDKGNREFFVLFRPIVASMLAAGQVPEKLAAGEASSLAYQGRTS
jgi:23S rRNA (cytidine1920-2'-O)/16S rRNA (cytidine1409-2'-O)-methyltransferase